MVFQRLCADRLSLPAGDELRRGVAAFPRRPIAFLWHYIRRRPLLHFSALAAVLGAAVSACTAQYGLKLIVDAMAQADGPTRALWVALAVFSGLLAGESALWRLGSWLGYRAMIIDKTEAKLDLFDHLGGHSSRYFTDRLGGPWPAASRPPGMRCTRFYQSSCSTSLRCAPISARMAL